MALRMVYGASGSGKSYNVYKRMIAAAEENPQTSYILLCPEQYSMMLQRKMRFRLLRLRGEESQPPEGGLLLLKRKRGNSGTSVLFGISAPCDKD